MTASVEPSDLSSPGPVTSQPRTEASAVGRLERDALGTRQVVTTSLAQIAPALGMFFNISLIVANVGRAAPLAVLLGIVGIAGTAYTLASFARSSPSVGSFISFTVKGLGGHAGTTLGVPLQVGYVLLNAGTVIALGVWAHEMLLRWTGIDLPWQPISLAGGLILYGIMIVGVHRTVKAALILFILEVGVLALLAILIVAKSGNVSLAPLTVDTASAQSGFGLAFVLSLYMFLGWEAPVTFSEETRNPRRVIPRAIWIVLGVAGIIYFLLAYVVVIGFGVGNMDALAADSAPFDTLAKMYGNHALRVAIDICGFTSICGSLLASAASQGRTLFDMGRIGMLPRVFGRVNHRFKTPDVALISYFAVTVVVIAVWGSLVSDGNAVFSQVASLGTIPVVVIYFAVNVAGIVYTIRGARIYKSRVLGIMAATLGATIMLYPLWQLIQPGQAAPFKYFPIVVLVTLAMSAFYAVWLVRRRPSMAQRVEELLES